MRVGNHLCGKKDNYKHYFSTQVNLKYYAKLVFFQNN